MSRKAPTSPAPGTSPFKRLSAGSVGSAGGGGQGSIAGYETCAGDCISNSEFGRSPGLLGLERAVLSTSESARTLDKVREVFEEVSSSNRVAASSEVSDVDRLTEVAEQWSRSVADNADQAIDAHTGRFSTKSIQGLLG
jgi:hypothetical protein